MAENSKIKWCDHTANFYSREVSPGCKNCYAKAFCPRFGKHLWGSTPRELKKSVWANVRKWNRQAGKSGYRPKVFVQSMSDFFEDHPQVAEWRTRALNLMQECLNLDFLVLTKRPENVNWMIERNTNQRLWRWFDVNPHVWIGASVENQEQADKRIPELLKIPASVRFLSCEPLLGPIDLLGWLWQGGLVSGPMEPTEYDYQPSRLIDWVIVGGESGPNARPMHPDWPRGLRDQCADADVSFFFKQWGEWAPFNCTKWR